MITAPSQEWTSHICEDPRLVQAGAYLHGLFHSNADAPLRLPLAIAGRSNPLSDVPIPDWPGDAKSADTRATLDRFVQAGWLQASGTDDYRLTSRGKSLFAAMPLYHHIATEDLPSRTPWLRDSIREKTVLDAGCGVGAYSQLFSRIGARRVIGIDYSADRLGLARRLSSNPRVFWLRGSIEQLPIPERSVDLVFSRVVLPYVHQRRTVSEFGRVLVRGGRALLMLHGAGFYRRQLRQCGLRLRNAAEAYRAMMGLAGGLAYSALGVEPAWWSRNGTFHLSYQTRSSFGKLTRQCGLKLEYWEENGCKPLAWIVKPAA